MMLFGGAQPAQGGSGRGNHQWRGGDYLLSWREGAQQTKQFNSAETEFLLKGETASATQQPGPTVHREGCG